MAEGPFVLWGDADTPLLRADFYGPDGLPVVSLRCDSSGSLVYLPDEARATYYSGGFPLGRALVECSDLVGMVRTGFPLDLPQWALAMGGIVVPPTVRWTLVSENSGGDTLMVTLREGSTFPSLSWNGGRAEVTSASPGDIYEAWPTSWSISGPEQGLEMSVRSISRPQPPPESVWSLNVPVSVDTVCMDARWKHGWEIPDR